MLNDSHPNAKGLPPNSSAKGFDYNSSAGGIPTLPKLPSLGLETLQLPDKRRASRCCKQIDKNLDILPNLRNS